MAKGIGGWPSAELFILLGGDKMLGRAESLPLLIHGEFVEPQNTQDSEEIGRWEKRAATITLIEKREP